MTILGRSEELVSRCVECDLAEPESLASLGGSEPGVVDGILSATPGKTQYTHSTYMISPGKDRYSYTFCLGVNIPTPQMELIILQVSLFLAESKFWGKHAFCGLAT